MSDDFGFCDDFGGYSGYCLMILVGCIYGMGLKECDDFGGLHLWDGVEGG